MAGSTPTLEVGHGDPWSDLTQILLSTVPWVSSRSWRGQIPGQRGRAARPLSGVQPRPGVYKLLGEDLGPEHALLARDTPHRSWRSGRPGGTEAPRVATHCPLPLPTEGHFKARPNKAAAGSAPDERGHLSECQTASRWQHQQARAEGLQSSHRPSRTTTTEGTICSH